MNKVRRFKNINTAANRTELQKVENGQVVKNRVGRPKEDRKPHQVRMKPDVKNLLNSYAKKHGITQAATIEKAIKNSTAILNEKLNLLLLLFFIIFINLFNNLLDLG